MRLILILLCLLPSASHAQITMQSLEKVTVYRGVEKTRIVKDMLIVPKGTEFNGQSAAVLPLEFPANQVVTVEASDRDRAAVDMELVNEIPSDDGQTVQRLYLVVATGRVWVQVISLDISVPKIDSKTFVVDLGDKPDDPDEPDEPDVPTPGPDVTVPEDRFDNIGRKVASAAKGLELRKEVAAVYRRYADELVDSANATDVSTRMVNERTQTLGAKAASWAQLLRAIIADFNPRVPDMQRADVVDYWRAVANGLDPGGAQ